MAIILALTSFKGANTYTSAKALPDGLGVFARNLDNSHSDMRGLPAANQVATLVGLAVQQISLYRMGRDAPSDTQYWLSSNVDTDYCRSLLATDPNELTYYTDGVKPKFTDTTLLGSAPYPGAYRTLGVPAPASAMVASISSAGSSANDESRVYLDTFVRVHNGRSEESGPNSNTTSITCKSDATINLSSLAVMPSGQHGITKRRIYCSTDGGEFLRVAELAVATTSYSDTGTRTLVLETGGDLDRPAWLEPPDGLKGLQTLWNSMAGGFVGKSYRICEAGQMHAWPIEYEGVLPDTIVGAASWGTNWLLCTTGVPYVVMGTTPAGMRNVPLFFKQACVSKRSVVGVQHGVCWASPNGLCYYGQNGMANLTERVLSPADWAAMNPASIIGVNSGRYYIGFYANGATRGGFMIDTLQPDSIIWLTQAAYGAFVDPISGQVYLLDSGYAVRKWGTGSALAAEFTSMNKRAPRKCCPGAAKVVATTYPVTFSLYADGVLKHTKNVTSEAAFRLPAGYMADFFQVKLAGSGPIEAALLADEIVDLP